MAGLAEPPSTEDVLDRYKRQPFSKGLLPFRAAVKSLDSPVPAISAQPDGRQRWVIVDKATKQPAMFSYAAIFAQSDHPETGNYVPFGEATPSGVDPKGIQTRANLKCLYTYVFDTFSDYSLYEGQWTLDEYMCTLPSFNVGKLPRRSWLSGQDEKFRARFRMQTPIFLRRGPNETRTPPRGYLHDWVKQVDQESKVLKANPDRPRVWFKDETEIVPIAERTPNALQRGDVVAVSFTVTYHLTSVNWFAQFHPADLVVVKSSDGDSTDYSAPSLGLYDRPPPAFDGIDSAYDASRRVAKSVAAPPLGLSAKDADDGVPETESQGSSTGTLEGDTNDAGDDTVDISCVDASTSSVSKGKSRSMKRPDMAEDFEIVNPDGEQLEPGSAENADSGATEEHRRSSKPGGGKQTRLAKKLKS